MRSQRRWRTLASLQDGHTDSGPGASAPGRFLLHRVQADALDIEAEAKRRLAAAHETAATQQLKMIAAIG